MAISCCLVALTLLAISAPVRSDPVEYENEGFVTRINCQGRKPQHFLYSSITDLWGATGGQIVLSADVTLHCLGDDSEGKYGPEALKYKVEIAHILISENKENKAQSVVREKRGAREFFSKSWAEVKDFFKRVFRRKPAPQPEVSRANHPDTTETPHTEQPEEDLDLSENSSLYSAPFQFVQLANGSIPEIRFAENEVDTRVKNFKRHLVDAFSTQLSFDQSRQRVVEQSVIGEHTSNYNISVSGEQASLSADDEGVVKQNIPTVVVKKVVTKEDILKLAPSTAVNDPDKMDLRLEQVQIFQEGRMVQSSGISSLTLMIDSGKNSNRLKREDAQDVTAHLQAQTTFDIQVQTRQRRSSEYSLPEGNLQYISASRVAEMEDPTRRWNSRSLPDLEIDAEEIFKGLLEHKDENYNEKLEVLLEIVEREISLETGREATSVSSAARKVLSDEVMQDLCLKEFSVCKDFLQLLAMAGGNEAEKVYLSLLSGRSGLSTENLRMVADILSDVPRPSNDFLLALAGLIEGNSTDPSVTGTVTISLGHLASKAAPEGKDRVSDVFTNLLRDRPNGCQLETPVLNVLEGIGNLKSDRVAEGVLEVAKLCKNNSAVQIACVHAVRHSSHLPLVQQWIQNATAEGGCELLSEIVASLTDTIQDQEMTPEEIRWPRFGFSSIDHLLKDRLRSASCAHEDIILYFRKKRNAYANELAANYIGSEPWSSRSGSRQKRSIWDDLNCQDWTEDSKFVSIQDREEFATDRATYNKRKSCLGFKKFGIKGANAEIYAGVFAGVKEPSSPPKYKLFTKFVSQLNFLGQELQIGSFRFHHQNGKMNANVKIMGRTRQEFTHDGCTPTDLTYRPLRHFPLFNVNIGIAQLSLGVQISSQLGILTSCPGEGEYVLEPLTNVRVGGEALGTVLWLRGAANLGGSFNYKLRFTFSPSPDMCLKGSHGHDPMNISFETYYQLWNKLKDDWGRVRTWKPGSLSWNITRGDIKPWFKETCIAAKTTSGPFLNSERELE